MTNPSTAPQQHSGLNLTPGMRVRISQQIPTQKQAWTTTLEGTVLSFSQQKTSAAFAHARDDRFWLDRLELKKDDGEITLFNLDQYSRIEILPGE